MMLVILAALGLLLRAQAAPVSAEAGLFYGTLCHSGDADRPRPLRPATGCDACLLCQTVHSDDGGVPILPARFVLLLPPPGIASPAIRPSDAVRPARHRAAFLARAPPAAA
jgi:hypothetical protein